MLMGCAVAETTGLYALVIAILLIFVAPGILADKLLDVISGNKELVKELLSAAGSTGA
jgi:F-type H+-transporting ATPase subunit c